MKTQRTTTLHVCDYCDGEPKQASFLCHECGKAACYDHKEHIHEYRHSVNCMGSGDMEICADCDQKLTAQGDETLRKFKAIEALREESRAFYEAWQLRAKAAEEAVKGYKPKHSLYQ